MNPHHRLLASTRLPALGLGLLLSAVAATATVSAAASGRDAVRQVATLSVPGQPLTSFDIGFVNGQGIYALADRANHGVDLIEAATGRPIATVGGFKGYDKAKGFSEAGPDGVVAVGRGEFWAGDGDSTVKVIDVARRAVVATISTGGHKRVDEMTYDPRDHLVVVVNNADEPPFVSFISSRTRKVLGKLALPRATDGAEQPVWNPATGLLYLSIPVLDHVEANGAVAVIDPRSFKLLRMLPVSKCMPAGLAAGPRGELLLGCSDDAIGAGFPAQSMIMDPRSGRILTTIAEVGGSDEVWYDPHAGNYYLAAAKMPGGPVLGVVNAHTRRWVANLPTGGHAHSVAADPRTGRIFVPIDVHTGGGTCPGGCIAVFAPAKR